MRKLIFTCIFIIFALFCGFCMSASAASGTPAADKIFSISKGGDTSKSPQYSAEAVESCIDLGFDALSVETGENGVDIDTLESILSLADSRIYVILDCSEEELDSLYETVKESSSLENVFFRSRNTKSKKLIAWAESKDENIQIIPSYDGNVIFSAISLYNCAEENLYKFCEFSSKNRYSVIFSEFFANRFENAKALSPVFDKDLSGQRNDSLHGWESVLALGYSAVETENAKEFADYISLLDESYLHLERVYNESRSTDLTAYSSNSTAEFKKQLKIAEEILNSEKPSSQLEINECIENISLASEKFELSDGDENGTFSITPVKIFWIAFAILLFVSSQIYLYKKTKKH